MKKLGEITALDLENIEEETSFLSKKDEKS